MHIPPHFVSMLAGQFALLKLLVAQQQGMAPHQLVAIGLLATKGPMLFKDLRNRLSLPKSSFTFLVDGLEKRELVERVREDEDRRQWKVTLTMRGADFAEAVDRHEAKMLEPVLAPLSEQEGAVLLGAMKRMPGAENSSPADARDALTTTMDGAGARRSKRAKAGKRHVSKPKVR